MNLLFIADPLESFNLHKDSTYVMMREAQRRGHRIAACEPQDMAWQSGQPVAAQVRDIVLAPPGSTQQGPWFTPLRHENTGDIAIESIANHPPRRTAALRDFDAVLMRKDPPFDAEYFYATHLLTQAQREGARVYNAPQALREHPEKLAILEFADLIAPTLVTRRAADIRAFHAAHGDIIMKPLDGMGGMGIFRVKADGLNLGSIIETLGASGAQTVMVQRFVPEIAQGDKRILIIAGEPVPYCLARIPQGSEVRGNLAAGGKGVAQALSDSDWALARAVGPTLAARGLLLVGLDVIGSCITEINVTSPTCFQEIHDQTGCDVPALFVDALERAAASR